MLRRLRPLTCQRPVRPGRVSWRRHCSWVNSATSQGRAWAGTDQGHVAAQHVQQLRQLVDAEAAQDAADPGDARVVLELVDAIAGAGIGARGELARVELPVGLVVAPGVHGAQLQHRERAPVAADPGLTEQRRPGAGEAHQRRRDEQGRRENDHRGKAQREVEYALARVAGARGAIRHGDLGKAPGAAARSVIPGEDRERHPASSRPAAAAAARALASLRGSGAGGAEPLASQARQIGRTPGGSARGRALRAVSRSAASGRMALTGRHTRGRRGPPAHARWLRR